MTARQLPLLLLSLLLNVVAGAQQRHAVTPHVSPTIRFSENLGQWNKTILMRALLPGGAMFVEPNAMSFSFFDQQKMSRLHHGSLATGTDKDFVIKGHFYRVRFVNALPNPQLEKRQQGNDYENFILDDDPSKWKSNVRNYKQVFLRGLYQGIDYELLAAASSAKYNFHVAAGADPSQIAMQYDGVDQLKISDGKLRVKTSVNEVTEQRPYAWQEINGQITEIPCQFKLTDNTVTFVFPKGYNSKYPLVIDPVLVFSAQIGSVADNFGMTATFDPAGNLYSAGTVYDPGYPTTTGAFDNSFNNQQEYGRTDVFVTKYAADGKSLLFSTYLGGSSAEVCSSLIVDKQGNLCMYGATGSANFPMNGTGADKTFNGGSNIGFITNGSVFYNGTDIYVCKLNSTGTSLQASTYFGGSDNDGINYLGAVFPFNNTQILPAQTFVSNYDSLMSNYGDQYRGEIQIDSLGNVYICSSTRSSNIPIVMGFDNNLGGKQDALVIKYNSSLANVLFSTYLGGSYIDCGNAIFITPDAQIYATGGTSSSDFPGTTGAHSPTYNGGKTDGFLSKISASGALVRTTFIGTSSYDNSFFVQCDKYGDVYVYGQSLGNMPVQTVAPSVPIYSVANTHQFIASYGNALTNLKMSTVFGSKLNAIDISPSAFAIDECNGNIYLSGWGGNILTNNNAMANMPLLNPTQSTTNGYDFYLMALKPYATALLYGSYFGGGSSKEHVDGGTSRFDRKGVIYQSVCAGCQISGIPQQDFPISSGAWPCPNSPSCPTPNASGNCNNGVFKINFDLQQTIAKIVTQNTVGCAPLTVTLTNSIPGTSYEWNLGASGITSVVPKPVVTFSAPGVYTVSLFVRDTTMCIREDTEIKTFSVFAIPQPSMVVNSTPCTNTVFVNAALNNNETFLNWDFGNNVTGTNISMTYTYPVDGIYTISLSVTNSSYGCKGSRTATVGVLQFNPGAAGGGSLCSGTSRQLTASGGNNYYWSPGSSLSSTTIADPIASPNETTIYTVTVTKNGFGQNCSAHFTLGIDVKPSPTADYDYTVHPCGGSVMFADKSYADITRWFWQFSSGDTLSKASPLYFYEVGGVNSATLTTTNVHGCLSSVAKSFGVGQASVSLSRPVNICKGQSTELTASGGYEYQWLPEESVQQPFLPKTLVTPSATTEYTVIIGTSVTNSITGGLCEYTLTTIVSVSELSRDLPVSASAQPSVIIAGNSTSLVYVGDPGASVSWFPLGNTNPGTGYTVSATPQQPTTYTVVARRDACTKMLTVDVTVYSNKCLGKDIFIPNTFTPNGDGHNDLFKVHGLSVDQVYFAVYNRWGEKVYETSDKMAGWDGRYQSKDADVGVFGWYLKVKCFNGEETFMKGNVTLIR